MVSQKLVQEVMEKLDRPCTAKDITDYIMDNKLQNISRNSVRNDVCGVLNTLRKWYTVEKFPDLHGMDSNKWYLIKEGNVHDTKNCEYCKGIRYAHNHNTAIHMESTNKRNTRLVSDLEHTVPNEFGILTRRW